MGGPTADLECTREKSVKCAWLMQALLVISLDSATDIFCKFIAEATLNLPVLGAGLAGCSYQQ